MDDNQWMAAKRSWRAADDAHTASEAGRAWKAARAVWDIACKARNEYTKNKMAERAVARGNGVDPVQVSSVVSTPQPGAAPEVPDPERVRQLINKVKGK